MRKFAHQVVFLIIINPSNDLFIDDMINSKLGSINFDNVFTIEKKLLILSSINRCNSIYIYSEINSNQKRDQRSKMG